MITPSRRDLVSGLAAALMLPAAVPGAVAAPVADRTGRAAVPGGTV